MTQLHGQLELAKRKADEAKDELRKLQRQQKKQMDEEIERQRQSLALNSPFMSPRQAAVRYDVSQKTILRWIGEEGLPARKLGARMIRIVTSEADDWVNNRR